jgi:hypothetical protein
VLVGSRRVELLALKNGVLPPIFFVGVRFVCIAAKLASFVLARAIAAIWAARVQGQMPR